MTINAAEVADTPKRRPGRPSKFLTLEQTAGLLKTGQGTRIAAHVALSLGTGIRTEEARALKRENVDLGDASAIPPQPASISAALGAADGALEDQAPHGDGGGAVEPSHVGTAVSTSGQVSSHNLMVPIAARIGSSTSLFARALQSIAALLPAKSLSHAAGARCKGLVALTSRSARPARSALVAIFCLFVIL